MRVLAVLTITALAAGCFNPVYNDAACSPLGECPDGFSCVDGVCRAGGGGDDAAPFDASLIDAGIDAMPPDGLPPGQCDPVAQTGCAGTEKCGRVEIGGTISIECYANGPFGVEQACSIDGTSGFDDCRGGLACIGGFCQAMCTLSPDSCGGTAACIVYSGVYDGTGFEGSLGLCVPTCDPVTQFRLDGGSCGPSQGCYGQPNGPFFCANEAFPGRVHGDVVPPPIYLNGCAAGFMPFMPDSLNPSNAICAAMCRPQETSASNPGGAGGAPGSGYTCSDRNAVNAECRFVSRIQDNTQPGFGEHDNVGYCYDYANYGEQSCTTQPDGDQVDGCYPF